MTALHPPGLELQALGYVKQLYEYRSSTDDGCQIRRMGRNLAA